MTAACIAQPYLILPFFTHMKTQYQLIGIALICAYVGYSLYNISGEQRQKAAEEKAQREQAFKERQLIQESINNEEYQEVIDKMMSKLDKNNSVDDLYEIHVILGLCHTKLGHYEEARHWLNLALQSPRNAEDRTVYISGLGETSRPDGSRAESLMKKLEGK